MQGVIGSVITRLHFDPGVSTQAHCTELFLTSILVEKTFKLRDFSINSKSPIEPIQFAENVTS